MKQKTDWLMKCLLDGKTHMRSTCDHCSARCISTGVLKSDCNCLPCYSQRTKQGVGQ